MPHAAELTRDQLTDRTFAAEVQYFRTDPEYWATILDRLVDTGLKTVTSYVPWEAHLVGDPSEKHPAGELDFEGRTNPRLNLHKFLELVTERGLGMNFRAGPFVCAEMPAGGLPPWLIKGDPNIMAWDYTGRPAQGYWIGRKEGMQPSYLHPTVLAWCRKWVDEVGPIIKQHLASQGGCVTMINLDNEVSYIVRDSLLGADYNPVNVERGGFYHQFLREKYGDGDLPYGSRSAAIEDMAPPRAVPDEIGDDLAWYVDWGEFKTWAMQRYLTELRGMYEAMGIDAGAGVSFMTNLNPHRPEGVPARMPNFEQGTGPGGLVGYDFYRGKFMSYSGYQSMARVLKLMNSSLGWTWSAEFMGGIWNLDLSKAGRVSADHTRFMARCALAHGCKGISWFMFHDRDTWGDSPVSSHGHPRPSHGILRDTVALCRETIKDWPNLTPRYDVAIVYDLLSQWHTYIGDPLPCNDNAMHLGAPTIAGVESGRTSAEYEGLFRLVEQAGYQGGSVDLMHTGAMPEEVKLAMLPGTAVIENEAGQRLRQWVERGGVLVVTGAWPTLDEFGQPLKFLGLSKPGDATIGAGRVIHNANWLGQAEPEQDDLVVIGQVRQWIDEAVGDAFHVRIQPEQTVRWIDHQKGGGVGEHAQPRNLGSAVLNTSDDERVLFVLNHYIDAVRFVVTLGGSAETLVDLDTGERIAVNAGSAVIDVDRKAGKIFRVA